MRQILSRRLLSVLLVLAMLVSVMPVIAEEAAAAGPRTVTSTVIENGGDMLKYGHIDIDIPADEFLSVFALGETVTVKLDGYGVYSVPVCASYDDVAAGEMLLRAVSGKAYVILAINYGQIGLEAGLIEKAPEGAETTYAVKEGVTFPIAVTISEKVDVMTSTVIEGSADLLKFGNINIDIPAADFLCNFALGETVVVDVEGYGTYEVPVCAAYEDVPAGEMLLRAAKSKNYVILAINCGQMAATCGMIEAAPEGSETAYVLKEGVTFPINVTISRKVVSLTADVLPNGNDMLKYGHIDLDYAADDALALFNVGDTVTVDLGEYGSFDVPVCTSYDDVAAGEKLLRVVSGKSYIILAINYGQIAMECGLIEKAPEGAETTYVVKEGVTFPITATVTLKDTEAAENLIGNLVRTTERSEYPALTDAQFANLRPVTTTGMGEGKLYRSSSPINPEIGRNTYADAAAAEAGIHTFVNLADNPTEAQAYPGYAESYYSTQSQIFLGLPVAFTTDTFKSGLAQGFRFMIDNEAPYLVHCTEGKDRAGLTSAVLECLMGATYDEVVADYTVTYHNYYSVQNGTQRALTPAEEEAIGAVIINNLKLSFGVEITPDTDLAAAAEAYLLSIGMTADEITALKAVLQ